MELTTKLGPLVLRTPLIAAAGTVGSVVEWLPVGDPSAYGAVVAKSISAEGWPGLPGPRLAPHGAGMLNAIGIENPGLAVWSRDIGPRLETCPVPVWGSAAGRHADEFALVAAGLQEAGVAAVEVNLSCPNLDGARFALDPALSARVMATVRDRVALPLGAKLSPDAADIAAVAEAVVAAGADFVVLTNTARGAAMDSRAGGVKTGGYSGPPLKAISLRCVYEVRSRFSLLPIVGCGGVGNGKDVADYLEAGADAVAVGTAHMAAPRAGSRILRQFRRWCRTHGAPGLRSEP